MALERKRVFRFDVWYHPVMAEVFADTPGFELTTMARDAPEQQILQALQASHVYQIPSARDELPAAWRADARLLAQLPQLLCISTNGAGYDTLDLAACNQAGVLVLNQSGANAQSVAEAAIGLMLNCSRRIGESDRRLRVCRGYSREDLMGAELYDKTLGLVGIGEIGGRVARIAQALGMQVLACDPGLSAGQIRDKGAVAVDLPTLLAGSDVVSLHCPRLAETVNLMDAASFAQMRPGAIFINTARGGLHDELALHQALASGHLGGAGIDVWDQEPPPLDHPLLALETVVALYHTAGVTYEARQRMGQWAAQQIIEVMAGRPGPRMVNPQVFPRFLERLMAANLGTL